MYTMMVCRRTNTTSYKTVTVLVCYEGMHGRSQGTSRRLVAGVSRLAAGAPGLQGVPPWTAWLPAPFITSQNSSGASMHTTRKHTCRAFPTRPCACTHLRQQHLVTETALVCCGSVAGQFAAWFITCSRCKSCFPTV